MEPPNFERLLNLQIVYVVPRAQRLRLSWWNINNPAALRNGFRTYGHRKEINFTLLEGDTKSVPPSEGNEGEEEEYESHGLSF